MLTRSWIVHSTFHKSDVLLLSVASHLTETDLLCWDLDDLAEHMNESQLDKLAQDVDDGQLRNNHPPRQPRLTLQAVVPHHCPSHGQHLF